MLVTLAVSQLRLTTMKFEDDGSVRFTDLDIGDTLEDYSESFVVPSAVRLLAGLVGDRFSGEDHDLDGLDRAEEVVAYCRAHRFSVVPCAEAPGATAVYEHLRPGVYLEGERVLVRNDRTSPSAPVEGPWFEIVDWRQLASRLVEDECGGPAAYRAVRRLVTRCEPPAGW